MELWKFGYDRYSMTDGERACSWHLMRIDMCSSRSWGHPGRKWSDSAPLVARIYLEEARMLLQAAREMCVADAATILNTVGHLRREAYRMLMESRVEAR